MHKYNTCIITGASSGIGASIARRLASEGTKIYAIARSTSDLKKMKSTLNKSTSKNIEIISLDVTNKDEVHRVFADIFRKQHVDLVISNAGVGFSMPFMKHSDKETSTVIDTNLYGNINVINASLSNQRSGKMQIVITSSLAGKVGFPNMSIYSASKFALEGMVESLRNEYRNSDVQFTILRPGIVGTSFFKKAGMGEFEQSVKDLKVFYTPDKVADIFVKQLTPKKSLIVVGNDKYFLKILPFIPFNVRFKILDIVNKI